MKVLILTTSYPLSSAPVSGIFVSRLASSFPEDVDVVVLTPDSRNEEITSDLGGNIELKIFKYGFKSWQLLAHGPGGIPVALKNNRILYLLLPSFIFSMFISCLWNSRNCDVIHANWSICGFIAGLVGIIHGIPVITTLRGEDFNRAKVSFLYRFLLLASIRLSKKVVCVNKTIYTWLIDNYSQYKKKLSIAI